MMSCLLRHFAICIAFVPASLCTLWTVWSCTRLTELIIRWVPAKLWSCMSPGSLDTLNEYDKAAEDISLAMQQVSDVEWQVYSLPKICCAVILSAVQLLSVLYVEKKETDKLRSGIKSIGTGLQSVHRSQRQSKPQQLVQTLFNMPLCT
eukprot:TRINITY_DN15795_c0_g1_i2.p1 TRINITY_DN15795_c0_g1~~TRINITY_DN15795_c0_g1_i2.p1  ORF type:complete len:149 (+),score=13.60 TRINITY_DN15795_c0_g1_i2:35-481(+)